MNNTAHTNELPKGSEASRVKSASSISVSEGESGVRNMGISAKVIRETIGPANPILYSSQPGNSPMYLPLAED